ncbi:DUF3093 domain-containing protein [Mycobacterium shinjukuense]|uniref:Uncharacterized protein n=1 Tax=Mycobacterium shinjukuense TaxID=398694 RepID=A0A7I7MUZ7_9MYCO|nr:DUF3093 domain-containing protein [Mycobacterium shinjukuense]MCV6985053.1 DUF3093 domain-containing protein [Mycobacterium shinjukuense]ORB70801.1 DUF3093 domain-containing protein [Mycobacterium shinjukuense]BBX75019.1 hypothetical protein MSHI_29250 [Mycobacterium shinjukuense]
MTAARDAKPKPLFYEPGASWYWLLAGPFSAASLIFIQKSSGATISLTTPVIFLVLVTAFVAVQVKAARIHTSVELTEESLRQGTETILVSEIVKVFPEPENSVASGKPLAKWQSARALGELVGVPRGRVGIGLRLSGGRTAQAWARRHRHLRAALTPLVEERVGPYVPDAHDDDPEWPL